jgi:hypothetical protein
MLQNPFYAGFVVYREQRKNGGRRERTHKRFSGALAEMNRRRRAGGTIRCDHGMLFPGKHDPLVSVDLYDRCQRARGLRAHTPSNKTRKRRIYPLSGTLRCERCGGPFRGNAGNGDIRYYEDTKRAGGASDCPRRSFRAQGIEEDVFLTMRQLEIPAAWDKDILVYLREGERWDDWRRERRAVQSRLKAVTEMQKQGLLSSGEAREERRLCQQELERLDREVAREEVGQAELLRGFSQVWEAATDKERRGLIQCVFSAIWLKDGEVTRYEVRPPFADLLPDV